ncbi:hypothetical protein ACFB49_42560 [Sphingomonas sp. DBB INV C78]|uniref:hypothetical protein n=1 Tax=Sphingomonas sp. DBB INV C78 TaxID=3349434 RepID=UPI0036D2D295
MKKIILYTPALCAAGVYRDAGTELTVGVPKEPKPDVVYIEPARARELIEERRAATWTAAKTAEAEAEGETLTDPLDHDADGEKGGAADPVDDDK